MVYLIATIILLGILISVHELGHFLVARSFGVRVEVFSLGFGPKLFKKKIGDTEYCLSAIPLGGYVKMYGDELDKDIPKDQASYGYLSQPIPKKMAIALAGPASNLLFAMAMFALLAFLGRDRLQPKVGSIFPGTPAYHAGLRTGDVIVAVNGEKVQFGDEVEEKIEKLSSDQVQLSVSQLQPSGNTQLRDISAPLTRKYGHNEFGQVKEVSTLAGLDFVLHAPQVEVVTAHSWAEKLGFQDKDLITHISNQEINSLDQVEPTLFQALSQSQPFTIEVLRAPKVGVSCFDEGACNKIQLQSSTIQIPSNATALHDLGLAPSELSIGKIKPYTVAEKSDIRPEDVILQVDGRRITYFEQFRRLIQEHGQTQKSMRIVLDRNGQPIQVSATPEAVGNTEPDQPWVARNTPFAIGIYPYISVSLQRILYRETHPMVALKTGVVHTWEWSVRFGIGLWKLITGEISTKMLSGPIYIGKMAGDMIQAGIRQFLFLMAIISLNLGLINLLPIPVLDGGHVMMFTVEAILRRKPSVKMVERAFKVGFVLIILLSLFAIYNDLVRVLN